MVSAAQVSDLNRSPSNDAALTAAFAPDGPVLAKVNLTR